MTSAAEAETGSNCLPNLLESFRPSPASYPLKTDNSTSNSFVHANVKQRRSKTWDVRWNWPRDKATHEQLRMCWDNGQDNDADKHHPPSPTNTILRRTISLCARSMF
jgi:hypothetical protein